MNLLKAINPFAFNGKPTAILFEVAVAAAVAAGVAGFDQSYRLFHLVF